jgi:hypothetical protein
VEPISIAKSVEADHAGLRGAWAPDTEGVAMDSVASMLPSQRVVQVCLFLLSGIALMGGTLQMVLGQPDTAPRLDNVHRFMAGIYFGCGLICFWAALTIRQQDTLVFLIAASVFIAGCGRLLSIGKVGIPEPHAVWLGYLVPELLLPIVIAVAQMMTSRATA